VSGRLWVVATPIGNLGDLSPRAAELLSRCAAVYCEDTRHSRGLYAGLGLSAPQLISCSAHHEQGRAPEIIERLRQGEELGLISDAGTPGISDPGCLIVEAVHRAGLTVAALPGPSSMITALSVSGLPALPSHLLGFPPRKAGELDRWLVEQSRLPGTLVLLESGRRLAELVAALQRRMPERQLCLCRELTKLHEEIRRCRVSELPAEDVPGEVVLVVGSGAPVVEVAAPIDPEGGLRAIAEALAERWGCPRREAYQALLGLERARS
jgi:16S rRNA (cytidine1402-2'-O)-methyltransferase